MNDPSQGGRMWATATRGRLGPTGWNVPCTFAGRTRRQIAGIRPNLVDIPLAAASKVAAAVADRLGRHGALVRVARPAYEALLNTLALGKGIPWSINGASFRIDAHYRSSMGSGVYDREVADYLAARVRPGDVCFDVGANVGVYVLQFARWSAPHGRIVAFEPNPAARTVLNRHLRLNAVSDRVEVVPMAVASERGTATMFADGASGRSRLGSPNRHIAGRASAMDVAVTTLDTFCESVDVRPDWLIIDIEGFEIGALRGARNLIARRRPRLGMIVELHPNQWPALGESESTVRALLGELGLRARPLSGQTRVLAEHGSVLLEYR